MGRTNFSEPARMSTRRKLRKLRKLPQESPQAIVLVGKNRWSVTWFRSLLSKNATTPFNANSLRSTIYEVDLIS